MEGRRAAVLLVVAAGSPHRRLRAGVLAHRDHGPDGLRLRLAGRAPLQHLQRLPVDQRHGHPRGGPHANLRIGMAVSLAAFYNPLRLAEEVALIDVLSGGRVNWGAGRGFDRAEFRGLRRAGGGELRPLPRVRRDRAGRLAERARDATRDGSGRYDGIEVPAQAAAGARTRRCGWPPPRRIPSARGREGLRHPSGSARDAHATSAASARTTTTSCARTDSPPRAG